MFRAVLMSSVWYVTEISAVESDIDNIEEFVDDGYPVVLADDLETLISIIGTDYKTNV